MLIRYLFLVVCIYFSLNILILLYKNLVSNDIKSFNDLEVPVNRRTSVSSYSPKRVSVLEKSRNVDVKTKNNRAKVKSNNVKISYEVYRTQNAVKR